MCGIALVFSGQSSTTDAKQVDIFQELLYITALRGVHGTGVFSRNGFAKDGLLPADFIDQNETYIGLKKQYVAAPKGTGDFLVGHCRQATKGTICAANTHPFRHGNITLVHNGTLRRQELLPDHLRFEVDSENIAYSLATIGTEETLANLAGAFALVWHDSTDDTLHLIKNSERPFFLQKVNGGAIYGASERDMLHLILDRKKVSFKNSDGFELENEIEYIFEPNGEWQMMYRRKCYKYATPAATANPYNKSHYAPATAASSATTAARGVASSGNNTSAGTAVATTSTGTTLALALKTTAANKVVTELKSAPALIESGYPDFKLGSEIEFVITSLYKTGPSNTTVEAYWLGKYEDVRIYSPAWYSTADVNKVYKGKIMSAYFMANSESPEGKELMILLQPETCSPVRALTLRDEYAFEAYQEGVSCEEIEQREEEEHERYGMPPADKLIGTCGWCSGDIFQSDVDKHQAEYTDITLETILCSDCTGLYYDTI